MTLECNYYFSIVFLQATAGEWLVFERFVTSDGAEVTLVPALEFRDLISQDSQQTCGLCSKLPHKEDQIELTCLKE